MVMAAGSSLLDGSRNNPLVVEQALDATPTWREREGFVLQNTHKVSTN